MTLHLLADAAVTAPDWRAWLTPETVVAVMSTIAALFGWLGKRKYERVARAIITGVESYRRDEATPPAQSGDVATAIRLRAEAAGIEHVLGPLVQEITRPKPPTP